MAYVDSLLASGERVVRKAHQHWFVMVWRARWAMVGLVLGLVFLVLRLLNSNTDGPLWTILGLATLALIVYGLASLAWGWLRFQNEEYVITSRRIIHAEGVVNKKATDSSLEKINDAILVESMFGRIFGFGNLEVLTASESGIERLYMLRDAKDFKKAMLDAKHELEIEITRPTMPPMRAAEPAGVGAPGAGWAPAAAAPAGPQGWAPAVPAAPVAPVATPEVDTADEVADALARLGELRDKGVITPLEFEAKKAELLARL